LSVCCRTDAIEQHPDRTPARARSPSASRRRFNSSRIEKKRLEIHALFRASNRLQKRREDLVPVVQQDDLVAGTGSGSAGVRRAEEAGSATYLTVESRARRGG
jgi:hypothetical protein